VDTELLFADGSAPRPQLPFRLSALVSSRLLGRDRTWVGSDRLGHERRRLFFSKGNLQCQAIAIFLQRGDPGLRLLFPKIEPCLQLLARDKELREVVEMLTTFLGLQRQKVLSRFDVLVKERLEVVKVPAPFVRVQIPIVLAVGKELLEFEFLEVLATSHMKQGRVGASTRACNPVASCWLRG
jgi:hypothetical protein